MMPLLPDQARVQLSEAMQSVGEAITQQAQRRRRTAESPIIARERQTGLRRARGAEAPSRLSAVEPELGHSGCMGRK